VIAVPPPPEDELLELELLLALLLDLPPEPDRLFELAHPARPSAVAVTSAAALRTPLRE
jgi:hypothetical protein